MNRKSVNPQIQFELHEIDSRKSGENPAALRFNNGQKIQTSKFLSTKLEKLEGISKFYELENEEQCVYMCV